MDTKARVKSPGRLAIMLAASMVAIGAVASIVAPATGATVPNRFYCKPAGVGGGWCYQVNAPDPTVGIQCHWKLSGMEGKPQQMWYTNCPIPWGNDVP